MLNFYRPFFIGLCLVTFGSSACAQDNLSGAADQVSVEAEQSDFDKMIASAAVILIAEVETPAENSGTEPEDTKSTPRPDVTIDLKKELDKAREETALTFTGIDFGPLINLNTVETLKGSKTQKLAIPASTDDLKAAKAGQLFLIFMGTDHPDAIRIISSLDDPWAQQIRAALAD